MSAQDRRAGVEALQHKASNPKSSAWVSANAGSGKTHVLAQRVVRLLLDGVDPSKILCLTFTKAAAANMSLRIFSMLGKWAVLDDEALRTAIRSTGSDQAPRLDVARKLFARAIEAPGGLKIQTIHAFCERVLHLFPFEANVPASFDALDDEQQSLLMHDARRRVLAEAMIHPDTAQGLALTRVASEVTGPAFEGLLSEALSCRSAIANASRLQSGGYAKELGQRLGLLQGENEETIARNILEGGPSPAHWNELALAMDRAKGNDAKAAAHIFAMLRSTSVNDRLESLRCLFYKQDGELRKDRKGWLVKQELGQAINAPLLAERDRIAPLYEKLKSAKTVADSVALHRLADAVLSRYTKLKQARGLLDFDDLIERTRNLLTREGTPGWVLFKLDAGIDHVLLDEAQDTSLEQWQIVRSLIEEFFSSEDRRQRTFFAVGDEKQSIFSFQGAEPKAFGDNARRFQAALKDRNFEDVKLKVSFRSCETVLRAVDEVFSLEAHYKGLSSDHVKTVHEAWKTGVTGLVEIWDLVKGQKQSPSDDWTMPLDATPAGAPANILAQRVAQKIKTLLDPASREAVHEDVNGRVVKRAVRAGDIMILVRRRNEFFDAIIRSLKSLSVPVAGADRLKLMDHIAAMDLIAAGRTALLPEDDFSLACVLKSPLFGLDDEDLIAIAPKRKGTLFEALRMSDRAGHRDAADCIQRWSKAARALSPYRFYAQILGADGGRLKMLARLGPEAGDAMDEFLRLALDWEHREAASLTAFLLDVQGAELEVKRDMEAAGEAVRVMTVHAAKGLEAKIVFMPDTCAMPGQHAAQLITSGEGGDELPVWRRNSKADPPPVKALLAAKRQAEDEEYRRLLYVAMTRAEERIYICGYHGEKEASQSCWYHMVRSSLTQQAQEFDEPWPLWRIGEAALLDRPESAELKAERLTVPDWLGRPAPKDAPPAPPIRPSRALSAADQFEDSSTPEFESRRFALLEGTLTHALLQYLPGVEPEKRRGAADRYLERRGAALDSARRARITGAVLDLMARPDLAPLFGPAARHEAAIAGEALLPNGARPKISGRIDCLAPDGDEIILADYKTGRPRPGGAASYVAQMALYRAALSPLFKGKSIRALLIWTAGPEVEIISAEAMDAALLKLAGTQP